MKSQNTKSSDELKREVDQQLRKVRSDLDILQGRLTPGQFIDDAIFYRQGKSLASTLDHLKRNPVGTTFLSLGTILLMEDENHFSVESNARAKVNTLKDSVTSVKASIQNQLPHKELSPGAAPSAGDIAKDKIHQMKEKVKDLKTGISTKLDDIQNRFSSENTDESNFLFDANEKGRLKDRATNLLNSGKDKVNDLYANSKDRIQNLDPLSYMALGAGLGVLTGAALPVSEKENEFVESHFQDRLSGLSSDFQHAINESTNILKDLVIADVKDYNLRPFK